MRKLKVMHVILSMETGGTQTRVAYLANHLDKEKFDFSICCLERIGNTSYLIDKDVKIFVMHKKAGITWLLLFRLYALLKREKIDIIHTQGFAAFFYSVLPARLAGVAVIIHGELSEVFTSSEKKHKLITRRLYSVFVNYILVNSNGLKEAVKQLTHIGDNKFKMIYNGVDSQIFKKSGFREDKKEIVIGTVSRLEEGKHQDVLIRAVPLVKKQIEGIRVLIIGDGSLRTRLERLVFDLGLSDSVQFLGSRTDVPSLLNTLDIFVLPSVVEGCSNAILEAMSSGLPVIAADTNRNAEVVENGVTGILFPVDNIRSLAEAILGLAQDKAKRERMGEAARKRIEEFFSIEKMVGKYSDLYLEEARRCIK